MTAVLEQLASARGVVALFLIGFGVIFYVVDRRSRTSQALAVASVAMGGAVLVTVLFGRGTWWVSALNTLLEGATLLAGIEWPRRIGQTAHGRLATVANVLFRLGQLLVLVFVGLALGYLAIFPELAMNDREGVISVRPVEWAVFAPVLVTALVLASLAGLLLVLARIDKAERVRLRALIIATPFLMSALFLGPSYQPLVMTLGMIIFLAGSVKYLMIQGRRGQFMSQFLSPEVAELVNTSGLKAALGRERRRISVLMVDLSGFSAYTSAQASTRVLQLLETFYAAVGEAAQSYGGTIKDHAGDGTLVLVGAPIAVDDNAWRAARMAMAIRERLAVQLEPFGDVSVCIGIATGLATVGGIRGAGRYEYVAVGTPINLAARLCDHADPGEILVDAFTRDALPEDGDIAARSIGKHAYKGLPAKIETFVLSREKQPATAEQ